jgi:hypothetical protein
MSITLEAACYARLGRSLAKALRGGWTDDELTALADVIQNDAMAVPHFDAIRPSE